MPRIQRNISSEHPFHLNARCINRDWFRLPQDLVWDIFCDYLYLAYHGYQMKIHAFVLMSNHFHLLASFPSGNMSEAMNYFMREVSREITRKSSRINQTFGGPFHSSMVNSYHYFLHVYKYLYRNPVEAGLVRAAEDYPYSTLHGLIGSSTLWIPVEEDTILMDDFEGTLRWLNQKYKLNHREEIQRALRRGVFTLPLNRNTRQKSSLEFERS